MTTHTHTRLAPLSPPYGEELANLLDAMMGGKGDPLALFRTLAHHPRLLKRFSGMGGRILTGGTVRPEEREVVIHRTCARCGCEYEWGVHAAFFGRALGFDDALLRATVHGGADDPAWSPRQALLIRLVDELHDTGALSDSLWTALAAHWSPEQVIELITTAGFYHLVSFLANGLGVPLEDFAERFPAS